MSATLRLFPLVALALGWLVLRSFHIAATVGLPTERILARLLVVLLAAYVVATSLHAAWAWRPRTGRDIVRATGLAAGFAIAYALLTNMVRVDASVAAPVLETGASFGPLTVWPDVRFALAWLHLSGEATLGRGIIALATAFALALGVHVVLARRACARRMLPAVGVSGSGALLTSACPACLPKLAMLAGATVVPASVIAWNPTSPLATLTDVAMPVAAAWAVVRAAGPARPPLSRRAWRPLAVGTVLALALGTPLAQALTQMPRGASDRQQAIHDLYLLALAGALALTLVVLVLLLAFAFRYREGSKNASRAFILPPGRRKAVIAGYIIVPTIVLFGIGFVSLDVFVAMEEPPEGAVHIGVIANRFSWRFTYPDGSTSLNELRIEEGQQVVLNLSSPDVIHSLFIPDMGVKMDAMPGVVTQTWFHAQGAGAYAAYCVEFCGVGHADMRAGVVVFPQGTQARPYGDGAGPGSGGRGAAS